MIKKILLGILFSITSLSLWANPSLWMVNTNNQIEIGGERKIIPSKYILAKFSSSSFKLSQAFIPTEESGSTTSITLPTPDGSEMEFNIFEAPMMEKALADKYPEIKTYTAIQKQNPLITAKIDFTLQGFHAMVFDGENTYFIDPYSDINSDWYIVYFKKDFNKPLNNRMSCGFQDESDIHATANSVNLTDATTPTFSSNKQNGTNKRTYRLALACTVEYSLAVNGPTPTKAGVLSAMVTTMNRVNGVFERDFSMHANLVANTDTLIWITAAGEPYTNSSGSALLSQNQTQVTNKIGSANYDYGHVFSTGGGGIASASSVCNSGSKAQGVTGSPSPVGDPFDIDYVAHEMGHQFGGMHTFNSGTGSCSGNRSSSSAYEIGSATTILGYAGICGTDDIQTHSDDYYHLRSLEQMTGASVTACATNVASGNSLPTLSPIVKTYIIPHSTSFELTATGTDTDNDPLTYCWEEYDLSTSSLAWNATTTTGPVLRSFTPTTNPTRTFPALKYLLQNSYNYKGEIIPANARLLNFKCTLRDLHNGWGAFYTSTDMLKLDVRVMTGLFRVTSQTTNGTAWQGWSNQTINWDVAGTNAAPVLATNVNIYLSVDSGKSWAYTLATNVPNNGTASIHVPNVNATWCRVKVKGADNVFFDLNDGWITITKTAEPQSTADLSSLDFKIFPNPTHQNFSIELPNGLLTSQMEIVNSLGTLIQSKSIVSKEIISVNGLSAGIYFVKIKSENGQQAVKKLMIY